MDPRADRRRHSPHPWWSRLLYLAYGAALAPGAWMAWTRGLTVAALVLAGIAAVLLWKAAQRAR